MKKPTQKIYRTTNWPAEIIDSINKYEAQVSYFEFTKDSRKLDKIVRYLDKDG